MYYIKAKTVFHDCKILSKVYRYETEERRDHNLERIKQQIEDNPHYDIIEHGSNFLFVFDSWDRKSILLTWGYSDELQLCNEE